LKIIFLPGTLKRLSKENSLDPNVEVSLEKQLFSLGTCKPGKYYTALPKSNMQTFAPVVSKQKF